LKGAESSSAAEANEEDIDEIDIDEDSEDKEARNSKSYRINDSESDKKVSNDSNRAADEEEAAAGNVGSDTALVSTAGCVVESFK
jgi:hypothetical protein